MPLQKTEILFVAAITLAAFIVGRWSSPATEVRADSAGSPVIQVQPIRGDSSLAVSYPGLNRAVRLSESVCGVVDLELLVLRATQ